MNEMNKKICFTKSSAESFCIDGGTKGLIYPDHPKGQYTIARINMNGVYPVIGYSINTKCTETIVMLKGEIKIRVDDKVCELKSGDILIILPKTKYRIEGQGEVLDLITPRWDKKQNKIILDSTFTIKI